MKAPRSGAEELALREVLGDGGAIAGDEGTAPARGEVAQRPSGYLLASPAFPDDEDGIGRIGIEANELLHGPDRGARADEGRLAA